ncbi:MAG: universal stress protein [Aquificaceae bacterium]
MIEKPAVYITFDKKEDEFLAYTANIIEKLNIEPIIVYTEGFLKSKRLDVEKLVRKYFKKAQIQAPLKNIDQMARELSINMGVDIVFLWYKRYILRRSLANRIINLLPGLKLWVYKNNCTQDISKVCLPVDFSERSLRQLRFASMLKEVFPIETKLVYALNVGRLKGKMSEDEYRRILKDRKDEAFHLFKESFGDVDLPLSLIEGDPYGGLSDHINTEGYDLTLVSRRGKGLAQAMGSVSQHLIRSLRCPIVVL